MKKSAIMLTFLLLFSLLGCTVAKEQENSVLFYYPVVELSAQQENAGFLPEARQHALNDDIGQLVSDYLRGPEDTRMYSPFASDIKLLRWDQTDEGLELVFTDSLSQMENYRITIACTALSATLFQATDATKVTVSCEASLLNGKSQLIFTPGNISWLDTISTDIAEETEATE